MRRRPEMEEKPSRSARKREAHAVEDLARALVDMPASALHKLCADEEIRRELDLARGTRGHGARDRQIRHLAAVLRRNEEETAVLREFVAGEDEGHRAEIAGFHRLEELRDRLCDPRQFSAALAEAESSWPELDAEALRRQARLCHAGEDRRAFREIFRILRKTQEAAGAPLDPHPSADTL